MADTDGYEVRVTEETFVTRFDLVAEGGAAPVVGVDIKCGSNGPRMGLQDWGVLFSSLARQIDEVAQ